MVKSKVHNTRFCGEENRDSVSQSYLFLLRSLKESHVCSMFLTCVGNYKGPVTAYNRLLHESFISSMTTRRIYIHKNYAYSDRIPLGFGEEIYGKQIYLRRSGNQRSKEIISHIHILVLRIENRIRVRKGRDKTVYYQHTGISPISTIVESSIAN